MTKDQVCVVGLGYVGLPLAVALSGHFAVTGLDVDVERIRELKEGYDRTGEVDVDRLEKSTLALTNEPAACPPADFYIVTVPTPVASDNQPDLTLIEAASRTVGAMLKQAHKANKYPVVIYESTVFPGVTEDICRPILEIASGLAWGRDFFLGYSPERINPGDREHTVDRIIKVVSGDTDETLKRVENLYNKITTGGVFRAASIRVAEAAKVIENAQRDINIAFMNEITQIFAKIGISVWDVLEAARTKWNFLNFTPGLVGGHCIGVDPYYLSHLAESLGHEPRVILAGRSVNDGMAVWLADRLHDACSRQAGRILVLGITFKENVPDLRNSKVAQVIARLNDLGHSVTVHDPLADPSEAAHEYALKLDPEALSRCYDLIVLAVPHREYLELGELKLRNLLNPGGILADVKSALTNSDFRL